jgi:signal transduction histidine kinase
VSWLKAHPFAADALLAALLTAIVVPGVWLTDARDAFDYEEPDALAVLLALASTIPLAWRRRAPMRAFWAVAVPSVAYAVAGYPDSAGGVPVIVMLYSVAAHCDRRQSLRAAAVSAVGLAVVLAVARWDVTPDAAIANVVVFATAWILGDNLRTRRAYVAGLEQQTQQAEQERLAEARRAVTAERTRIARELHDVVAHSVSVMVVQAGAARRVLDAEPEKAREALHSVEHVGRQSLTEMRRLLGVLRRDDEHGDGLVPQPSLEHLHTLVAWTCEAGLPVEVEVVGEPRPLPFGVDLSAYRIVQEALTNALKHAGPASATVRVCYGSDDVLLEIADDGRGLAGDGANGQGGHGLVGMRERTKLFGGDLTVGGRRGGGFVVRARLPIGAAS